MAREQPADRDGLCARHSRAEQAERNACSARSWDSPTSVGGDLLDLKLDVVGEAKRWSLPVGD